MSKKQRTKNPEQRAAKRGRQKASGYKAPPGKKGFHGLMNHGTDPRARHQTEEAVKRMEQSLEAEV